MKWQIIGWKEREENPKDDKLIHFSLIVANISFLHWQIRTLSNFLIVDNVLHSNTNRIGTNVVPIIVANNAIEIWATFVAWKNNFILLVTLQVFNYWIIVIYRNGNLMLFSYTSIIIFTKVMFLIPIKR